MSNYKTIHTKQISYQLRSGIILSILLSLFIGFFIRLVIIGAQSGDLLSVILPPKL
jgi:hypothetical protein